LSQNAAPEEPLSSAEQLSTPLKLTETGIRIKPTLAFEDFSLDRIRPGRNARAAPGPVFEAIFEASF
jgi:hypothetical protein